MIMISCEEPKNLTLYHLVALCNLAREVLKKQLHHVTNHYNDNIYNISLSIYLCRIQSVLYCVKPKN